MKNLFSWMLKRRKSSRRRERWAQASEAKKHVKLILKQLKGEKAAMEALIEQLRYIVTKQVFTGEDSSSLAGHFYKRMTMKCALLMIKCYCTCILHHLPLLAEEGNFSALPSAVQEAVAGLMFASGRCDSPELAVTMASLSELFQERYAPYGGEPQKVIDSKVDERLRKKYLGEEELADDVKERLGKLIASRCDLGLKFPPWKEDGDELQSGDRVHKIGNLSKVTNNCDEKVRYDTDDEDDNERNKRFEERSQEIIVV